MAKTAQEKLLEKQLKQQKDAKRKMQIEARKEATRQRAASVVGGSNIVEGFRIMDSTAEDVLRCLLRCERSAGNRISFSDDILPEYVQRSTCVEYEKLIQYGMIGGLIEWDSGAMLNLMPAALTYFEDKEAALKRQNEAEGKMTAGNTYYNYGGNMVFGDVVDSTLSVDNSIHQLERSIEERGGDDKAELMELLEDVKELIANIESSRTIPKQKKLFQRLNDHVVRHGWFYGAVIQLLGTVVMNGLGT